MVVLVGAMLSFVLMVVGLVLPVFMVVSVDVVVLMSVHRAVPVMMLVGMDVLVLVVTFHLVLL